MLNDAAAQRPPRIHTQHTPHSSYDARADQTPTSDMTAARPTPYNPPLQSIESRVQQGGGGYFAMQSPHPNTSATASTPSAGPHSAYAQSPGSYITSYTPRESVPPSHPFNAPFVSPSSSVVHHPPTPGSAHINYNQPISYSNSGHPPNNYQFHSPPPPQVNGLPPSHARHISPTHQFQGQPATPLGPPLHYQKISPHSHRPPSQGHEQHFRRPSQSSIGSVHSTDYNHHPLSIPVDPARRDSIPRTYPHDMRERERSISVSPKTIPKPAPYRELSTSSRTLSQGRQSLPPQPDLRPTMSHSSSADQVEPASTPQAAPSSSSPPAAKKSSADHTLYQSPAPEPVHEPISVQTSTSIQEGADPSSAPTDRPEVMQSALKRSASHLSDSPVRNKEPPAKRRRREDIPIWAQSARGNRKLNFIDGHVRENRPSQSAPQQRPIANPRPAAPRVNGNSTRGPPAQSAQSAQPAAPIQTSQPVQPVDVNGLHWESTLADTIPFEDLTRNVCNWVLHNIKDAVPPKDSMFEIEAKIGQIVHNGVRVRLPVFSEAVVDRESVPGLRFDSTVHLVSGATA